MRLCSSPRASNRAGGRCGERDGKRAGYCSKTEVDS